MREMNNFTSTHEPYDRHRYKIVSKIKTMIVESWEEVREWWWNNCHSNLIVEVLINQRKNLKVCLIMKHVLFDLKDTLTTSLLDDEEHIREL